MSWHYNLAKKTGEDGIIEHQLIEVYLDDDDNIQGYTGHTDIFGYLLGEDGEDADIINEMLETLEHVRGDLSRPVLDLDTVTTVGFDLGEIEAILGDN